MPLKTKVKVGNITNLSDARYCAGMGVDLLGFPIGDGPDQISLQHFQEITEWVAGPEFVFEPGTTIDQDLLLKVTEMELVKHVQLGVDMLQTVGRQLNSKSIILSIAPSALEAIKPELESYPISYILLRNNENANWNLVERINAKIPVLLDQTASTTAVSEVLQQPISGIALAGSKEMKPGQKDYENLADVLEELDMD